LCTADECVRRYVDGDLKSEVQGPRSELRFPPSAFASSSHPGKLAVFKLSTIHLPLLLSFSPD
jgi:hypothetical protein